MVILIPLGVWQAFGYLAMAGKSLKIGILQKHKMAARALVWPRKFLVKKQKLLNFVNHWRSTKSGNSEIKNWHVKAIFHFLAFLPLLIWQFQAVPECEL